MLVFAAAALFLLTLGGVGALGYWVVSRSPATAGASAQAPSGAPRWVERLTEITDITPSRAQDSTLRRRLHAAGLRQDWAPHAYQSLRTAGIVVLPVVTLATLWLFDATPLLIVVGTGLSTALAMRLPERYLRKRIEQRRTALNIALPDFLDLLVIGVESGLSLDQAISDTARDLRRAHPVLWDELNIFRHEMIAGAGRAEALRNLGQRAGAPELRKLTSLLIQADRFGASVSKVLRTQARYMRIRRRQAAEEKAHKIGVKLLFPIFFLIMPSVFLVTAGPAVIMLVENFSDMANGR